MRRFLVIAITIAIGIGCTATRAGATTPVRDVSFPQCGTELPASARGGIIGVNGGRAFTSNPCMWEQLGWSKKLVEPPAFYANTGNPGPWRSKKWPTGQQSPRECSASNPNSLGCSFDYGWNAAKDSFRRAMDGAQKWNGYDRATAQRRVANVDWWLDVETMNSWQTLMDEFGPGRESQERDTQALIGAVRALWDEGVERVGIYSTAYQWRLITGGWTVTRNWFSANPVWLAGFDDHEHATSGCAKGTFTGGPVVMTQYLGEDGIDANVVC
jgi:hypothetical protein